MLQSNYVFVLYDPAIAALLKQEIKREHPMLKPAFMRPGFMTFKSEQPLRPDFKLKSVFARAYGLSFGNVPVVETVASWSLRHKPKLHLFARPGIEKGDLGASLAGSGLFDNQEIATIGDWVIDVMQVEQDSVWLGCHIHAFGRSPNPAGDPHIKQPKLAPSRAYLKIEEAIAWAQIPFVPNETVVEIGSAPGGSTYALLQRGLKVTGFDPARMADVVHKNKNFSHVKRAIQDMQPSDLPSSVQWFVIDVNLEPEFVWHHLSRLVPTQKPRGLLWTLKLKDLRTAQTVPKYLQAVRELGVNKVFATHLPSNAQELCVYGVNKT
jgi:23S rRNA (cytidine2498-2'-O)-methyltransferase